MCRRYCLLVRLHECPRVIQTLLILRGLRGHISGCRLRLTSHQLLQLLQLLNLANVDLGKRLEGVQVTVSCLAPVVEVGQGRLARCILVTLRPNRTERVLHGIRVGLMPGCEQLGKIPRRWALERLREVVVNRGEVVADGLPAVSDLPDGVDHVANIGAQE